MFDVRRCDVPADNGPSMHIRRLKANQETTVIILSRALVGLWTHWMGGCSLPCITPKEKCKGCVAKEPNRQKFLLHVYNYSTKQEEVLELPPGAATDFLDFYPQGATIRGQRLKIKRGNGKKARLTIDVLPAYDEAILAPMPAEKDPIVPLCELWSMDTKSKNFTKDLPIPQSYTG